jgi:hypothetical protein
MDDMKTSTQREPAAPPPASAEQHFFAAGAQEISPSALLAKPGR